MPKRHNATKFSVAEGFGLAASETADFANAQKR